MVLLEKLWDDIVAGPRPNRGLGKFRKINANLVSTDAKYQRSLSIPSGSSTPGTPRTPTTPSASSPSARKEDVWRSVFNPGNNPATRGIGAQIFDKPSNSGSPTVYDWFDWILIE